MAERSNLEKMMDKQRRDNDFATELEPVREGNKGQNFIRVKAMDLKSRLLETFKKGKPRGHTTGITVLDPIFRWRRNGGLYGFSGYPQHGKTEFLFFVLMMKCKLYKTKCVIYSPEEEAEDVIESLCRTYLRKNVDKNFRNQCSKAEFEQAMAWVDFHFIIIVYNGMPDFNMMINEFTQLAGQGYSDFVIDPFNQMAEGSLDEGGFKYLKVVLSHFKTWSTTHKANVIIVEHQNRPRPDAKGNYPRAHIRNITGGSMWENKCDSIFIIHSLWTEETKDTRVDIQAAKVKQQRRNGQRGTRSLYFDINTGSYLENDPDNNQEKTGNLFSESAKEQNEGIDDVPF